MEEIMKRSWFIYNVNAHTIKRFVAYKAVAHVFNFSSLQRFGFLNIILCIERNLIYEQSPSFLHVFFYKKNIKIYCLKFAMNVQQNNINLIKLKLTCFYMTFFQNQYGYF